MILLLMQDMELLKHLEGLTKLGVTPIHRTSFEPVKSLVLGEKEVKLEGMIMEEQSETLSSKKEFAFPRVPYYPKLDEESLLVLLLELSLDPFVS